VQTQRARPSPGRRFSTGHRKSLRSDLPARTRMGAVQVPGDPASLDEPTSVAVTHAAPPKKVQALYDIMHDIQLRYTTHPPDFTGSLGAESKPRMRGGSSIDDGHASNTQHDMARHGTSTATTPSAATAAPTPAIFRACVDIRSLQTPSAGRTIERPLSHRSCSRRSRLPRHARAYRQLGNRSRFALQHASSQVN